MRKLPSVAATVLALLLVGAGVGSVTALDTGATDALSEQRLTDQRLTDTRTNERVLGDDVRADRSRIFETRVAGIGGTDWLDDLDAFLAVFDLTEAEQETIVGEVDEMRADGATAADVHHMVHYRLYENGYDARDVHAYAMAYRLGEEFDLTDTEVSELATGIVAELDAGADRSDVREYVRERLDEFGVTDEERRSAVVEQRLRALAERHDLTDDQTDELVAGALDLVADGAERGELREYVRDTLDEFGVGDRAPTRGERRGAPERTDGDDTDDGDSTDTDDSTDQ